MSNRVFVMHIRGAVCETFFLVAFEIFLIQEPFWTFAAKESWIVLPGCMVLLDMLFELSFFCGSSPNTAVICALLRFCVCLHVPSKFLSASRPWKNMSRWSKLQFPCSKIFLRLTAAFPGAVSLVVYDWSSVAVCLDCGIPGSMRSGRVLSG
jgi:hypothetical protein